MGNSTSSSSLEKKLLIADDASGPKIEDPTISMEKVDAKEIPPCICKDLWKYLNEKSRTDVTETYKRTYGPPGFDDKDVWEKLPDDTKEDFWGAYEMEKLERISIFSCKSLKDSNIYQFFLGHEIESREDMDSKVNSMALISALVLTIPFGLFTALGDEYWSNLQVAFETCSEEYPDREIYKSIGGMKALLLNNLMGALVASIIGILFSTFYYLFKPCTAKHMTMTTLRKLKMLITLLFCTSVVAMVCIINVANILNANYLVGYNYDLCHAGPFNGDDYRGGAGIACGILGLFISFFLVW